MSTLQAAILVSSGLQHKSLDDTAAEFNVPMNQIMAHFLKTMAKLVKYLRRVQQKALGSVLPASPLSPRRTHCAKH